MNKNELYKGVDEGKPLIKALFLKTEVDAREKRDKASGSVLGRTVIRRTVILVNDQSFTRDEFMPDGTDLDKEKAAPQPFKRFETVVLQVEALDARGDYGAMFKGHLFPYVDGPAK